MYAKVLDQRQEVVAGTSTTSGTSDFVMSGSMPWARAMTALESGGTYWYHARYESDVTSGYEWGTGTWNGSNTLSRDSIKYSSNSNAKVSFSGADLVIVISESAEMMSQFMIRTIRKGAGTPYFLAGTGQSNFNNGMIGTDWSSWTDTAPDYISDWSVANPVTSSPQGYDETTLAWRSIDHTEVYTDSTASPQIAPPTYCIGYLRRDQSYQRGHQLIAMAHMIHHMTGCHVYTLFVAHSSTTIADATRGWLYDDTVTTSASTRLATQMDEVLNNEGTLGALGITAPDFFAWVQGESDIGAGTDANLYSSYLLDFIYNAMDSSRWGWADRELTQFLVCRVPQKYWQERDESWAGPELAVASAPPNVHLFDTEGFPQAGIDQGHYAGTVANKIGRIWAEWLVGAIKFQNKFSAVKYIPGKSTQIGSFTYDVPIESDVTNPTTNGDIYHTTAHDTLKIHNNDTFALADSRDKLLRLGEQGYLTVITMTDTADTDKWIKYTISAPGTDNSTYVTFAVTGYTTGPNGAPTTTVLITLDNAGVRDGTGTVTTSATAVLTAYAQGNDSAPRNTNDGVGGRGKPIFGPTGELKRFDKWGEVQDTLITTLTTVVYLGHIQGLTDGVRIQGQYVVAVRDDSTGNTANFTVNYIGILSSGTFTVTKQALTTHWDDITLTTTPTIVNVGGAPAISVRISSGPDTVYTCVGWWQEIADYA